MRRIWARLSYANVMSTLALFAALGGGAYAASTFVHSGGVVDLCVSRGGAVKVLAASKSKCGKGTSLVAINQRGPAGAQGPTGPQGPAGTGGTGGTGVAYSAGAGLTLAGTSFSADLTKVQARIAGSGCASDQALQAVAQDGTPTCKGLHAYSATAGIANFLQNNALTFVPAGNWLLIGQAQATTGPSGDNFQCKLLVGSQTVDSVNQSIAANGNYTAAPIATITTTAASSGVQIICNAGSGSTIIGSNITIAAIPLAGLN
jgi:hypothetical protein